MMVAVAVALAGCDEKAEPPPDWTRAPRLPQERESVSHVHLWSDGVRLEDGDARILVRPYELSETHDGRIVVTDIADKDVKVYDRAGRRVASIGRAGIEAGEFVTLASAQAYGDSVVALDPIRQRLTVFDAAGRPGRIVNVLPPAISAIRVMDDSLWLVTARAAVGKDLVRILRPSGEVVSAFFERSPQAVTDPAIAQHTFVVADGAGGRVIAGNIGGDSLFLFAVSGQLLASGPVDVIQPLAAYTTLLRNNGGKPRKQDGAWYFDGARVLFKVVALKDSIVAFVASYDTRNGTDLIEGGTVLVHGLAGTGLRQLSRLDHPGGLLGRARHGSAMFLQYAGAEHDGYIVRTAHFGGRNAVRVSSAGTRLGPP